MVTKMAKEIFKQIKNEIQTKNIYLKRNRNIIN